MASKNKGETSGRGREIFGIGLLGLGVFSAISLISMQAGRAHLMGPGGAWTARGLYSLLGLPAYWMVLGELLLAVRMCRARPLINEYVNVAGFFALLASSTVLLYLPFAGQPVYFNGPGGFAGQFMADGMAGVVGSVGTALIGVTVLCTSLLLLTHVRVSEVIAVLAWAGRHAWMAISAAAAVVTWFLVKGARGIGRLVVAMFP
jgi:hypothetical protein